MVWHNIFIVGHIGLVKYNNQNILTGQKYAVEQTKFILFFGQRTYLSDSQIIEEIW
ncbi:hypothetical protein FC83_GL001373 [Agrilactobacillus composti DSM 18527 = JCM 14202]|uniref:Uncharacterized protein n=1 Tax=Agrilactobacillus composti DSM 18527 = JCM 14202 TaxID=1423734 RepID=X0PQ30_9LACO|nr:hypothetical protein FC83_GL001373 [Agrilactobacillus composti DSM 18527 = JCM 14202]GAF39812.1 hypothetical protein JCM14202_1688 [Agrilactobacillus composti DSM 18527 = JCM 14202]